MGLEIERKFLVRDDSWRPLVTASTPFRQGYFDTAPGVTVRLRVAGDKAFLTVKGIPAAGSSHSGAAPARSEFEYPVPRADAEAMLREFCGGRTVEKVRHIVPFGGRDFEIDVFSGRHAGLVVAELELESADAQFAAPPFLGVEVTSDLRYSNHYMALH